MGDIYSTERQHYTDDYGKEHTFFKKPKVCYIQLDDKHFIIPKIKNNQVGNVLFFINEDNKMEYKGNIEGKINKGNKMLIEQKKVISTVTVDEVHDRYDTFIYSWDKNKRVSDKWSNIVKPEQEFQAKDILINKIELPVEGANEIIKIMQEKEALLTTLDIHSDDNQYNRICTCLIGMDGIPLTDLIYISQTTYEVETTPLKKDKIGEVDEVKEELQKKLNIQAGIVQNNKQNLGANFLKSMGLAIKANKQEKLEDSYLGEDK